jgi:hypothetical protein
MADAATLVYPVQLTQPGLWMASWAPAAPQRPITGAGTTREDALTALGERICTTFGVPAGRICLDVVEE